MVFKKKFFAPVMGAVMLGLSAYAGVCTYDAFAGGDKSDLLLANAEALAIDNEGQDYRICHWESKVVSGRTYYDCGTCKKVYDERGKGRTSKCFIK